MTAPVSLLPGNVTPLERALSLAVADQPRLPVHLVASLWDPWTCPLQVLPYLAWAASVDLWDESWGDQKKRAVIAASPRLHRLKGTLPGADAHLRIAGARLVRAVRPRQFFAAGRDLSRDEMDAWLHTMPQIRIYFSRERAPGRGEWAAGRATRRAAAGHGAARIDRGPMIYGRAARLWDRGTEVPLATLQLTTEIEQRQGLRIERFSKNGRRGRAIVVGRSAAGRAGAGSVAQPFELVTVREEVAYEHRASAMTLKSARPGLAPVDVRWDRMSLRIVLRRAFAARCSAAGHAAARAHDPARMMFDRLVLHDPARAIPRMRGVSAAGRSRVSMPAHRIEMQVATNERRPRRSGTSGRWRVGRHACHLPDPSRAAMAQRALAVSKAHGDQVLFTGKLTRPRRFADGYPLDGSITLSSRMPYQL